MRVIVMIKANEKTEAGVMPSQQLLIEMGRFNEELVKAGVMLSGEGLHPSSKAKRVRCAGGELSVTDGPFTETKELIAGFWMWRVKSMDEAVAWARRMPNPDREDGEVEIRPVFEMNEFDPALPPPLLEQEERVQSRAAKLRDAR